MKQENLKAIFGQFKMLSRETGKAQKAIAKLAAILGVERSKRKYTRRKARKVKARPPRSPNLSPSFLLRETGP